MYVRRTGPGGCAVAATRDLEHGASLALAVICVAVALVLPNPVQACAGWPLASLARVMLGFGAVYSAGDGETSQHRGVDIEAAAGDRVVAPIAGRVSFVGSVPGVGGGRVVAVTIESERGRVTLLPLERASVVRGTQVGAGDGVGTLAGGGDGSSAGAHLHVGVREGDLYVDPLGLIAPPPAPAGGSGAGAGAGVAAGQGATGVSGAPAGAGISAGVSLAPAAKAGATGASVHAKAANGLSPGVSIAVRGAAPSGDSASNPAATRPASAGGPAVAAGGPQSTVLTGDGIVVAAGTTAAPRQASGSGWVPRLVARARDVAERSVRIASLVLLGVMAALGALWPLWRGAGRKGSGKVPVSAAREDVAAAPSR